MKRIPLLTISLLGNVLLTAAAVVAVAKGGGWHRMSGIPRDVTNRSLRIAAPDRAVEPAASNATVLMVTEPFHWAKLESSDYRIYIKNLREVGCPEATIRDMIRAEVDELFAERVRDLVNPQVPQFWNLLADKEQFERLVEDKAKQINQLEDDRRDMLKLLLGRDGQEFAENDSEVAEVAETERRRQFYGFLPAEKREQAMAIEDKYRDLLAELGRSRLNNEEKQRRVSELTEAKNREWAQFLTTEELSELRTRQSPHANLRYSLAGFQASEGELKSIVGVYEKYAAARESREPNVDLRVTQRAEALRQQRDELVALLGEDRVAEFERAQDNEYQQLYRLGRNLSVSQEVVVGLFDQQKQSQELARQLRADRNLSAEERSQRLSDLRERLEEEFRSRLGQANYELYRRQGTGQWIDGLR
jgi:hypothetical protein